MSISLMAVMDRLHWDQSWVTKCQGSSMLRVYTSYLSLFVAFCLFHLLCLHVERPAVCCFLLKNRNYCDYVLAFMNHFVSIDLRTVAL